MCLLLSFSLCAVSSFNFYDILTWHKMLKVVLKLVLKTILAQKEEKNDFCGKF